MIELAPYHKRGLALHTPWLNTAGVLGLAEEYRGLLAYERLGAFITNPLTYQPRTPAAPPNAVALAEGWLIHTGLPDAGLRQTVRRYARQWERLGTPVIVHLAATTRDEMRRSVEVLEREERVVGVEAGFRESVTAGEVTALLRALRGPAPVLARLPAGRAAALLPAALAGGADALTVSAPPRRTVTLEAPAAAPPPVADPSPPAAPPSGEAAPREASGRTVTGRYFGRDVFATALAEVCEVLALAPDVPVVAAGGVFSLAQAQAMLAAGAVAVQLDAVLWEDPSRLSAEFTERPEHPA